MALAKPEISLQIPSFNESCQTSVTHVAQKLMTLNFLWNRSTMFQMMSLSNDVTESNNFFLKGLKNSILLNCLLFNQVQTSFFPCLITFQLLLRSSLAEFPSMCTLET